MRLAKYTALALLAATLFGCGSPGIEQYRHEQPALDVAQWFKGHTEAWGMFQKRSGEVVKRFHVDIYGTLAGDTLTLDERFKYSDGSTQQRVWTLKRDTEGRWRGRAADVVGEAEGESAGNALHWSYVLKLPVDGEVYEVSFDDWMYLIDANTMVNRASMRKFGFELGQVTLFFRRNPAPCAAGDASCSAP